MNLNRFPLASVFSSNSGTIGCQSKPTVHPNNSRKWILLVAVIKNMDSEKFYFQIDYKGVKRTSSSEFGEGCSQETIFVEVAADAFANSVDDAAIDSAVEEIALTTARQVARQNLAELENSSQSVSRLEELPPIFQEVEPTVQESGVRAWLSQG
jgi:hypothetical protein